MQTSGNGDGARRELGSVDLGDPRRTARLLKLCGRLSEMPESALNQAWGEWAETKAAYRFFHNEKVEGRKILAAHQANTFARARPHRTMLALQDTSYLVYTSHRQTTGLGKLSFKKGKRVKKIHSPGLLMQSGLAVTTDGLPPGLLEQKIFARESVAQDQTKHRNVLPIEEKESSRWLAALKNSKPVRGNTPLVTVCDREADIDELFQLSAALAAPVLVRATYDRPLNKRSMYAEKDIMKL